MASFITSLNGVITGVHSGDINADFYGTSYYGHDCVEVQSGAEIVPLDKVEYYTKDWKRKPNAQLIDEGLLPMPAGYTREGDKLKKMTSDERVLAGIDKPKKGFKVENGSIKPMTLQEKLDAGDITKEDYTRQIGASNEAELRSKLLALQTPEMLAQADVDESFAEKRKAKLKALLDVKKQKGWPVKVDWPADGAIK